MAAGTTALAPGLEGGNGIHRTYMGLDFMGLLNVTWWCMTFGLCSNVEKTKSVMFLATPLNFLQSKADMQYLNW
jgi:hypothetical protein